jgi:hypothetical protein
MERIFTGDEFALVAVFPKGEVQVRTFITYPVLNYIRYPRTVFFPDFHFKYSN